jgi:hypothetical protein
MILGVYIYAKIYWANPVPPSRLGMVNAVMAKGLCIIQSISCIGYLSI